MIHTETDFFSITIVFFIPVTQIVNSGTHKKELPFKVVLDRKFIALL